EQHPGEPGRLLPDLLPVDGQESLNEVLVPCALRRALLTDHRLYRTAVRVGVHVPLGLDPLVIDLRLGLLGQACGERTELAPSRGGSAVCAVRVLPAGRALALR